MAYNIALQFEDGVTRIIPCDAERTRRRRRLPRQDQHSARLPRRRLRHLQVPLRKRQATRWATTSRTRSTDDEAASRLRAHLPDEADIGLRDQRAGVVGGVQDRSRHARRQADDDRPRLGDDGVVLAAGRAAARLPARPVREPAGAGQQGDALVLRSARRRTAASCRS